MIAYFARRIVGGVVTLFLAGLMIYTFVKYGPQPRVDPVVKYGPQLRVEPVCCRECCVVPGEGQLEIIWRSELDKIIDDDQPWPVSYFAWLFNPDDITYTKYEENGDVGVYTKGIDIFGIKGNGILTGDLGESVNVDQGMPVVDVFGQGLGEFMLLLALLPFTALAFLAVQRRGRSSTNGLPNLPQSRKLFDQYLPPVRLPGL